MREGQQKGAALDKRKIHSIMELKYEVSTYRKYFLMNLVNIMMQLQHVRSFSK